MACRRYVGIVIAAEQDKKSNGTEKEEENKGTWHIDTQDIPEEEHDSATSRSNIDCTSNMHAYKQLAESDKNVNENAMIVFRGIPLLLDQCPFFLEYLVKVWQRAWNFESFEKKTGSILA